MESILGGVSNEVITLTGTITGAQIDLGASTGDTLTTTWTVTGRNDKPRHGGGIVVLAGVCRNQDGVVVADADAKMLVRARG